METKTDEKLTRDWSSCAAATMSSTRSNWPDTFDQGIQSSIWCSLCLHDWQQQEKCTLLCKIHWLLSNTDYSESGNYMFLLLKLLCDTFYITCMIANCNVHSKFSLNCYDVFCLQSYEIHIHVVCQFDDKEIKTNWTIFLSILCILSVSGSSD